MRGRSCLAGIAAVLLLLAIAFGAAFGPRAFRLWAYMQPYYRLVDDRANESAVLAQMGRPNLVLTSDAELRRFARDFIPFRSVPMRVESKVLVYWADPWGDGEGYAVYVFLDKQHRACEVVMGGG